VIVLDSQPEDLSKVQAGQPAVLRYDYGDLEAVSG
jgi:hypothetical protein